MIVLPRPSLTRDRLIHSLSEEVPKSHREIISETGLSPSSVWNGLKRCWEAGLILRTRSAIFESEMVFRGRAGSVQTTRPYHLYLLRPTDVKSVKIEGVDVQ